MTVNLVQVQGAEAQRIEKGKNGKRAEPAGRGCRHDIRINSGFWIWCL